LSALSLLNLATRCNVRIMADTLAPSSDVLGGGGGGEPPKKPTGSSNSKKGGKKSARELLLERIEQSQRRLQKKFPDENYVRPNLKDLQSMAENYAVSRLRPPHNERPGPGGYQVFAQSAAGEIPPQPGCELVNEPGYSSGIFLDEAPLAMAAASSALVINETPCERCTAQPPDMAFEKCCYLPGLVLDWNRALTKNIRYHRPGMRCCLNCLAECFRKDGGDDYFALLCEGGDPQWNKDTV
jgi:hypothetical protein